LKIIAIHAGLLICCSTDVAAELHSPGTLSDTNFDVMIADLNLPDGDGVDLLGEAKLLQPPLKAIAITGRAADTDRARGIAAGFHFYLTKPVDFSLLREALESLRRKPQQN
jgi:DNA-binding response OmpR family regulator